MSVITNRPVNKIDSLYELTNINKCPLCGNEEVILNKFVGRSTYKCGFSADYKSANNGQVINSVCTICNYSIVGDFDLGTI